MNNKKLTAYFTMDIVALLLYVIHIILNILEFNGLTYFYYLEVIFFTYAAFKKPWQQLLIPTFVFFFIEGQGRVITNYNPLFRNIFDFYIALILLKSIIRDRRIANFKQLPRIFSILILCHFIWYFIQIFNYQSVGPLGVIFASKIYIFPILMFLMFLREKLDINEYNQNFLLVAISSIIFGQVYLIFHQMSLAESHMLSISPYYNRIMGASFVGALFRPFGTSFVPGGVSVHFAYISAMLLFIKSNFRLAPLVKIIAILAMISACFVMQVRTSLIQLILISFLSGFCLLMLSKLRLFLVPLLFSSLFLIPIAIDSSADLDAIFPKLNLGYSVRRLQALSDIKEVKGQRASFKVFYNTLATKLEKTPLGLGPGRTGAANALFINKIKNDLEFGTKYSWTLDNLFISLAIDFGWGMIFYTLLVILLPIYLLWNNFTTYLYRKNVSTISVTCAIASFVILLSNWGAIAIPYNPVSFFFWFFVSTAMIELQRKEKNFEQADL